MGALIAALALTFSAQAATDTNKVKLQILNKINAEKSEVTALLDQKTRFQDLEIRLHRCRKSDRQEKNEHLAMLEIYDIAKNTPREQFFYGWMFSSSPALSAMEHPIYDVIVLECVN